MLVVSVYKKIKRKEIVDSRSNLKNGGRRTRGKLTSRWQRWQERPKLGDLTAHREKTEIAKCP